MRRHPLLAFFLLAFGFSWSIWPFVLLNSESTPVLPFGPLVAALVLCAVLGGRRGVGRLLRSMAHRRVPTAAYVVALGLPVLMIVPALALHIALGAVRPTAADVDGWWYVLPLGLLTGLVVSGPLGEEPGWRGFAQPRLQARYGQVRAAVLLGLVWSVWHLPLMVSGPDTSQRPALPFTVSLVAMSVVYAWLAARTDGSVLLAMLLHAATNTASGFVLRIYHEGPDYVRLWWLYAGLWVAAALVAAYAITAGSRGTATVSDGAAGDVAGSGQ